MALTAAGPRLTSGRSDQDGPAGRGGRTKRDGLAKPARSTGVRAGQIVAVQVAAALLIAASGAGYLAIALAALAASVLVMLAWVPMRQRWLYQWLSVALRYLTRRRALPAGADAAAFVDLVAPGGRVEAADVAGDAAAVLSDGYGLTAVLELGDPVGLLAETVQALPSPAELLPAAGPEAPRVRIQLVVTGVPAPVARAGAATSATSYRQLTEGRLLGQQRALLAVRIVRDQGWGDEDLRRALSGVVRKVRRRLGGVPSRPLGETALLRAIVDLAHHDGAQPVREAWAGVHAGGLAQVGFRLRRRPDARSEVARHLVSRLLSLPAAATTVAVTAGPRAGQDATADIVVRVAVASPAALTACVQALGRLAALEAASVRRLDGEHLDGLAATLPLGGADLTPAPGTPRPRTPGLAALEGLDLPVGAAGLMIGTNRHGTPLLARLFRAEPTRAMLVGGVRGAQLIVLRAMALGARVVVQTARPQAWEPFVRGVSTPGETIAVIPPGRPVTAPAGTPLYPLLVVVDVGPVAADGLAGGGWQATLVVRDDLGPVDVDALARADLVVLQPLRPNEAALAGVTLGLGDAAGWLTRIRPDMVGVVNRRAVRWALLSPTPIEQQLIGPPGRG
ncbi:MAG TPA: type VII secretion protein EccE [Pilimelia sp.]|nr:type VII secretion protein EccE [Pilimelia sp.]